MPTRSNKIHQAIATLTLCLAVTLFAGFLITPAAAGGGGGGVCTGTYQARAACREDCSQDTCPSGFYKCNYKEYNLLLDPQEYQLVSSAWQGCYLGTGGCPNFCND
jgi:hypothetical protein